MASKAIDMRHAAAKFFTASHFAVAGASSIPSKYGYKIFDWYLQENLSAIPINPTISSITVSGRNFDTLPLPSSVQDPKQTSLSIITPPSVTAKILREAKEAGLLAVWLQPGSFGEDELKYAVENWPDAAVGGFADEPMGHDGWCVLVDGYDAMKAAKSLNAKEKRTVPRVSRRPKKSDAAVGRKARVKKHVTDKLGRTENMRMRRVLANLE